MLGAIKALEKDDKTELGLLINQSHISMRDDFEISREEMDLMVTIAQSQKGCFGARMTGGGFGGCAVALVERDLVEKFQDDVARKYLRKTGLTPRIYTSLASAGTSFEAF